MPLSDFCETITPPSLVGADAAERQRGVRRLKMTLAFIAERAGEIEQRTSMFCSRVETRQINEKIKKCRCGEDGRMTQTPIAYVDRAVFVFPRISKHKKAAAAATLLPCLLWFIDMKRGGQAPIIHEEPVQRQLGSVVRAGSINEWVCAVCAVCARGVWVP